MCLGHSKKKKRVGDIIRTSQKPRYTFIKASCDMIWFPVWYPDSYMISHNVVSWGKKKTFDKVRNAGTLVNNMFALA